MKTWEAWVTYPDEELHCFVYAENEREAMQEALERCRAGHWNETAVIDVKEVDA